MRSRGLGAATRRPARSEMAPGAGQVQAFWGVWAAMSRWLGDGFVRSRRGAVSGYIDHVDATVIRGWAWDALAPTSRLSLDVFCGGLFLGSVRTGVFRLDLFDQRIGDGRHGFVFHVPSAAAMGIDAGRVEIIATHPTPARLITACGGPGSRRDAPVQVDGPDALRSVLLALVRALQASSSSTLVVTPNRADAETSDLAARKGPCRRDLLCVASDIAATSAFTAHIARKYSRSPTEDDTHFWRWYLEGYGVEKGPARAPLSAADLQVLRREGWSGAISAAARYAWAVHESRRLFVEDCLVDRATCLDLAEVPAAWRWTSFPPSRFMQRFKAHHHLLRARPFRTKRHRIELYAVLMLFALRDAHYLRYMPKRWLDAMLAPTPDAPDGCLFEGAQRTLFGDKAPVLSRAIFLVHLDGLGFDVGRRSFVGTFHGDHRLRCNHDALHGDPVDVQMIGPFRQSLGLAESCRRIAKALGHANRGVHLVNYDIGCARASIVPDAAVGDLRRARVNILHLNAEEVPEAMAYLPDAFSQSHTILVPYWELDRPSPVHRLGLQLVDEVWAATHFLEGVFSGAKPVTHIGMSHDDRFEVSKAESRCVYDQLGIATDRFTVVTTSDALSWTQRKNVLGAIEAFVAAFDDDAEVRLIVKTRNGDGPLSPAQAADWQEIVRRCTADPRVTMIDTELSARTQRALLSGADCLLSLHRAEGLGLDILDALHAGTPVVATAYSGSLDVCKPDTAWLVEYDLVPVAPTAYAFVQPGHVWAQPRLASAVAALRDVRHDAARRERRVSNARRHISEIASPAALAARLALILDARLAMAADGKPRG